MQATLKPEILSPRMRRAAGAFDDESLDLLSHLLDDWFRIPGTTIRFGLDGIVGFIPGVGDAIGGIASCIIIFAAWVRGVSYVTLARMLANWGIEVLLGTVPVLGNLFDSWLFFAVLCALFAAMLVLPMLLFGWLSMHLVHALATL